MLSSNKSRHAAPWNARAWAYRYPTITSFCYHYWLSPFSVPPPAQHQLPSALQKISLCTILLIRRRCGNASILPSGSTNAKKEKNRKITRDHGGCVFWSFLFEVEKQHPSQTTAPRLPAIRMTNKIFTSIKHSFARQSPIKNHACDTTNLTYLTRDRL